MQRAWPEPQQQAEPEQKREWEPWPREQRAWPERQARRELPVLPGQQVRQEPQDEPVPAAAWSGSCAERWEPRDVRERRVPAAQWTRHGEQWAAQGRQEQPDAGAQEPWELRVLPDAEARVLRVQQGLPGAEARVPQELPDAGAPVQ